jgi:hypothetical protein
MASSEADLILLQMGGSLDPGSACREHATTKTGQRRLDPGVRTVADRHGNGTGEEHLHEQPRRVVFAG